LRILIGFAFLPAGLKKIFGGPFTDPDNVGVFHEFMHAFHATGPFYRFVGAVQLVGAVLLMTQRFASAGVALLFPVLTAIFVLCWSTAGIPTIATVSLMFLGLLYLVVWDLPRWTYFLGGRDPSTGASPPPVQTVLWERAGSLVAVFYSVGCLLQGGVYRPRGLDFGEPGLYVLFAIALVPLFTWCLDRSRSGQ